MLKGESALFWAAANGKLDCVAWLLERETKMIQNTPNDNNSTPTTTTTTTPVTNTTSTDSSSNINTSTSSNNTTSIDKNINSNSSISNSSSSAPSSDDQYKRSETGDSPLHVASHNGHTTVVNYLLEKGMDVEAINKEGMTPLHMAAHNGKSEVVRTLIAHWKKKYPYTNNTPATDNNNTSTPTTNSTSIPLDTTSNEVPLINQPPSLHQWMQVFVDAKDMYGDTALAKW